MKALVGAVIVQLYRLIVCSTTHNVSTRRPCEGRRGAKCPWSSCKAELSLPLPQLPGRWDDLMPPSVLPRCTDWLQTCQWCWTSFEMACTKLCERTKNWLFLSAKICTDMRFEGSLLKPCISEGFGHKCHNFDHRKTSFTSLTEWLLQADVSQCALCSFIAQLYLKLYPTSLHNNSSLPLKWLVDT